MNPKKISWIFIIFGLCFIALGGLYYHVSIKRSLFANSHRLALSKLDAMAFEVNLEMGQLRAAVELLAASPVLQDHLNKQDLASKQQVDRFVDAVSKAMFPSVVFLMDRQGQVLSSSNREDASSFVGNNYSFRPYFQKTLEGDSNVYLAFGVTSRKKGFYFASPIMGSQDPTSTVPEEVLGVLVVKQSLDLIDKKLREFGESGTICFVSPEGVIFASTEKSWEFKSLGPLTSGGRQSLRESRQFGDGPFEQVPLKRMENTEPFATHTFIYLSEEGVPYTRHEQDVREIPNWHLLLFHDIQKTKQELINPVATKALWSLAPGLLFVVLLSIFLFFSLMRALNKEGALVSELQTKIAEIQTLRGILPICCYCKKIRTDEDAWHHIEVYISDHSSAEFSHGVCPECMSAFDDDLGLDESDGADQG